ALLHAFGGTKVPAVQVLPYAGAFGPCIAAMACAGVEGRAAVGRLLRGILAARQSWIWYVVALFLMPACMMLAKVLSGRPMMDPGTPPVPMQPVVLVMVFASILLAAGGWRGNGVAGLRSASDTGPVSAASWIYCPRLCVGCLARAALLAARHSATSDTVGRRRFSVSCLLRLLECAVHVAVSDNTRQFVHGHI